MSYDYINLKGNYTNIKELCIIIIKDSYKIWLYLYFSFKKQSKMLLKDS